MDSAAEVLLIVVSSTLTVFLIVGIVALVYLIKILKEIKRVTEKAGRIADKAEAVGEFFQKTAGSTALVKLISNILNSFKVRQDKE